MSKFEKFLCGIGILVILGFGSYAIMTPSDKLIREDGNYLYYMQYTTWGFDSAVHKFHKPIYYDGHVTDMDINEYIIGILGKGGHWNSDIKVIISYDNRTYTYEEDKFGYGRTPTYPNGDIINKGDKVKVIETFYPRYEVTFFKQ